MINCKMWVHTNIYFQIIELVFRMFESFLAWLILFSFTIKNKANTLQKNINPEIFCLRFIRFCGTSQNQLKTDTSKSLSGLNKIPWWNFFCSKQTPVRNKYFGLFWSVSSLASFLCKVFSGAVLKSRYGN